MQPCIACAGSASCQSSEVSFQLSYDPATVNLRIRVALKETVTLYLYCNSIRYSCIVTGSSLRFGPTGDSRSSICFASPPPLTIKHTMNTHVHKRTIVCKGHAGGVEESSCVASSESNSTSRVVTSFPGDSYLLDEMADCGMEHRSCTNVDTGAYLAMVKDSVMGTTMSVIVLSQAGL